MAEAVDFWELFRPLPKQVAFLQATRKYRYLLYGGARGGGKSKLLRWGLLWLLLEWAKKGHNAVRVGLFSEDYPTLKDRQIGKIKVEFPRWLGTVKSTNDEGLGFYLNDEYGGGAILLRNLDDPSKYQSAEFAAVAVEELTKNPKTTFDTLRGSLRWPGIEWTQFWGATNPGGPGHLWVKALWVDGDFSDPEFEPLRDREAEFHFIRSLPSDNPHLPQSYWDELNSLPDGLRRAWVEGDWDVFEGQAFPEWRRDVHVARYEPERGPDKHRYRWTAAGDWGGTAPGVFHLFATGPERSLVRYEWKFQGIDPYRAGYDFGQAILRFPRPEWLALDAPPVADNGPTIAERVQKGLRDACGPQAPPVISIPRGPGSRITKKQLVHEALAYAKADDGTVPPWGRPKLQFHPSCKYAIRTVPALPLAENDPEDVDTDADDHAYDSVAGWLMARTPYVEREQRKPKDPDAHPGYDEHGRRKDRRREEEPPEPRWSREPAGVPA